MTEPSRDEGYTLGPRRDRKPKRISVRSKKLASGYITPARLRCLENQKPVEKPAKAPNFNLGIDDSYGQDGGLVLFVCSFLAALAAAYSFIDPSPIHWVLEQIKEAATWRP